MAAGTFAPASLGTSPPGKEDKLEVSPADQEVIAMGIPEMVVAMAHAYQRFQHGTDTQDVQELYKLADDIYSNPQKQFHIAKKMAAEEAEKTKEKKKEEEMEAKEVGVEAAAGIFAEMQIKSVKAPATTTTTTTTTVSIEADNRQQLQEKVQRLARENQRLRRRKACRKCGEDLAKSGVTFLPCGHFITCEPCSEQCEDCLSCGNPIMGTVRTFLS